MDNVIGEIRVFPYDFVPKGWMSCDGSLLPINQNQALFSLLGTTYGGNGVNTFALPDLRGRATLGYGQGTSGQYMIGEKSGSETVMLAGNQIPPHTHILQGSNTNGVGVVNNAGPLETIAQPVINAITGLTINSFSAQNTTPTTLGPSTISISGSSTGHQNLVPYLALTVCIAITGIYPSRN